jgi:hypothetical protein
MEHNDPIILLKESSQMAHSQPESERMVTETDYSSCWDQLPLSSATIIMTRSYQMDSRGISAIRKTLEDEAAKGIVAIEPQRGLAKVSYLLRFGEPNEVTDGLGVPQALLISSGLNIDTLSDFVAKYESMNLDEISRQRFLDIITDSVFGRFYHWAREIEQHNKGFVNAGVLGELEEDYKLSNKEKISKLFPQYANLPVSQLIKEIKSAITKYVHGSDLQYIQDFLDEDDLNDNRNACIGLPNAGIYHDIWYDSHFVKGYYPEAVHFGTIATLRGGYDNDAPVVESMLRTVPWVGSRPQTIYAPPSMTNIYELRVPAITPQIVKVERKLDPYHNKYSRQPDFDMDGRITFVFCDTPERINPVAIKKICDERYGEGHWTMVMTDEGGKLVKLAPKPREEWHITSRKPHKNIPLTG